MSDIARGQVITQQEVSHLMSCVLECVADADEKELRKMVGDCINAIQAMSDRLDWIGGWEER